MTTPDREQLQQEAAIRGKDRNSRRLMLLLSMVLILSTITVIIGGALLWNEKQAQALAGKDLAIKVQQACLDPSLKSDLGSICSQAKKVEQQIKEGPQGPPGLAGPAGPAGADGVNGVNGQPGANGKSGRNGINGINGKDGATGPAGPAGPAGKDGADGANGTNGNNAYPMTWTFNFSPNPAQQYSFICVLQDPATQVDCTPQ